MSPAPRAAALRRAAADRAHGAPAPRAAACGRTATPDHQKT